MIIACRIDKNHVRHRAVMLNILQLSHPVQTSNASFFSVDIEATEITRRHASVGGLIPSVSLLDLHEPAVKGFPLVETITPTHPERIKPWYQRRIHPWHQRHLEDTPGTTLDEQRGRLHVRVKRTGRKVLGGLVPRHR